MPLPHNDASNRLNDYFLSHFNQYLGKATSSFLYKQRQTTKAPPIRILGYDDIFGGCRAFCSVGFSSYKQVTGDVSEIFVPVDIGWKKTPDILSGVLFYIIQERKRMGRGLSIRFADIFPDFSKMFGKSALYFTIPYDVPDGFNHFPCGSDTGYIYLAFYISEAEHQYFIKVGAENFETFLEQKNIDVFNVSRQSAI